MSFLKKLSPKRSLKSTKKEPGEPKDIEDEFVHLERYQGNSKDDKRHGQGAYYYDNGDIYDGEWRKGRKEGYGIYTFADGKRNVGWFYRDEYVGKEPNENLKRKMRKKTNSSSDDAKPLQRNSETTSDSEHDSQSDDDYEENAGVCQRFHTNCKKISEKAVRDSFRH